MKENCWKDIPAEFALSCDHGDIGCSKLFFVGWCPIYVAACSERKLRLSFPRGWLDIDKFLLDVCEQYRARADANRTKRTRRRHYVYRYSGRNIGDNAPRASDVEERPVRTLLEELRLLSDEETASENNKQKIDSLYLCDALKGLQTELRHWLDTKQWFTDRGLAWRRSYLLCGRPGTGKTVFAVAVAQALDIPLMVFDLGSLSNSEMEQHWQQMLNAAPCMVLLEDIDVVFEGRSNITAGMSQQRLTFDFLLNLLDGPLSPSGAVIVLTTNNPDKLDSALGVVANGDMPSRPGRIDRIIQLGNIDEAGRRKLAARILPEWPEEQARAVESRQNDTPAQFQEYCARLAMKMWEQRKDASQIESPVEMDASSGSERGAPERYRQPVGTPHPQHQGAA